MITEKELRRKDDLIKRLSEEVKTQQEQIESLRKSNIGVNWEERRFTLAADLFTKLLVEKGNSALGASKTALTSTDIFINEYKK